MKVIRGETTFSHVLLTSTGELLPTQEQDVNDLLEEEARQACKKGKKLGEKIGYAKGLEESRPLLNLLQSVTGKILEQKGRLLDQLKPEIIEFAIAVCERVVRKELSHPHALVRLINALLVRAIPSLKQDALRVVLASQDYAMLEDHLERIHYNEQEVKGVQFVADPMMRQGDCRIETTTGLLNYDIARELADLQAKVLQR